MNSEEKETGYNYLAVSDAEMMELFVEGALGCDGWGAAPFETGELPQAICAVDGARYGLSLRWTVGNGELMQSASAAAATHLQVGVVALDVRDGGDVVAQRLKANFVKNVLDVAQGRIKLPQMTACAGVIS